MGFGFNKPETDKETNDIPPLSETIESVPTPAPGSEAVTKPYAPIQTNTTADTIINVESENEKSQHEKDTKLTRVRPSKMTSFDTSKGISSTKKNARRGKCRVENPDIKRFGKNAYSVPKSTVKHYTRHWNEASRLAHLGWAIAKDGSRLGIRIRGIPCQAIKIHWLRRGDIVLSVNDHAVQSEKDLLKVYGKLLFWKEMDLKVKRGNGTIILRYNIV